MRWIPSSVIRRTNQAKDSHCGGVNIDVEVNMEDVKGHKGLEKRTHPRFQITIPAFLRLSAMKEGNPTILELECETGDISLEG